MKHPVLTLSRPHAARKVLGLRQCLEGLAAATDRAEAALGALQAFNFDQEAER